MLCYLASPIDSANLASPMNPTLEQIRLDICAQLKSLGWAVYQPHGAWSADLTNVPFKTMRAMQDLNFDVIQSADLVLALVPPAVPSTGVPIEVYYALEHTEKANVAIWNEGKRLGVVWGALYQKFGGRMAYMHRLDGAAFEQMQRWIDRQMRSELPPPAGPPRTNTELSAMAIEEGLQRHVRETINPTGGIRVNLPNSPAGD